MVNARWAGGIIAFLMAVNAQAHLHNGEAYPMNEDPFAVWNDSKNEKDHHNSHHRGSVHPDADKPHDEWKDNHDDAQSEERHGQGVREDKPDRETSGLNRSDGDYPRKGERARVWNHRKKNSASDSHDDVFGKKGHFKSGDLPAGCGDGITVNNPKPAPELPDEKAAGFSSGMHALDGEYQKNKDPLQVPNDPIRENEPFAPHDGVLGKTDPLNPWNSPLGGGDDLAPEKQKAYGLPRTDDGIH